MQAYLREHIPLAAAIGVQVLEAERDRVRLEAPLAPNLNHRSTAFGGSVAALAILAGWTLVHTRLRREGLEARIVIQHTSVQYDAPIDETFTAVSQAPDEDSWARFTRTLSRRGKARVHVSARVESAGRVAATFTGAYVAMAESVASSMS